MTKSTIEVKTTHHNNERCLIAMDNIVCLAGDKCSKCGKEKNPVLILHTPVNDWYNNGKYEEMYMCLDCLTSFLVKLGMLRKINIHEEVKRIKREIGKTIHLRDENVVDELFKLSDESIILFWLDEIEKNIELKAERKQLRALLGDNVSTNELDIFYDKVVSSQL